MTLSRTMVVLGLLVVSVTGCEDDDGDGIDIIDPGAKIVADLTPLGQGVVGDRYTAELWIHGTTGYTTTWGTRTANGITSRGNAIKIWNVSGNTPVLVDSVIVSGAITLGDIQVTTDGRYLIAATELSPGSIVIYDLTDPRKPSLVSRFQNADTNPGVHTAEVQPVAGKLYAFLSIDPGAGSPARLVIVDISNPAAPTMVFSRVMGSPFVHDVFVRDGILMTALWNDGVTIWDIGGGGKGGTVANPVQLGNVRTVGGKVHNIYWGRDVSGQNSRFAIVGEEGPSSLGFSSSGDVHVIDVSNMASPKEVAFLNIPGAGVHNFSADDSRGIVYAAYYNGGVVAIDIRGDLSACSGSQKSLDGRCDLVKMGRLVGKGPAGVSVPISIWGVHFTNGKLYASDMLNGLWAISPMPAS